MKSAAAKIPEASRSGCSQRLKRSMPDPVEAFAGGAVWAVAMAASAFVAILMQDWETSANIQSVAVLFALGGALSFPLALFIARFLSLGRSSEAALAAAFFSFVAVTVSITGLIFAFDYRTYYSEWHADAGSIAWVFQLVFTTLAALYQFAVLGVRLLFPVGFVALFAVSLWFTRMPR